MATVEVRNLTKQFGDNPPAVDGIDLASKDGEFLVLLGPSGCGKTTLLRMIGGLEPPTSGDVYIGGRLVNGLPPRARQIAMVFQSYALYPHMSVAKNIAFPLSAQKVPKDEQKKKIEWAASILGIEQLLDRKPRQLSGGQRQRVALARALVRDPNVFLLDEPLSNLDAQRRASARDELQQFQRRVGTTTIYVTHDQVEAMGLGDRIAVMSTGRVRQIGKPSEVYDDPADTFVATFIGSPPMNLVPHGAVLLGFRPEHLLPVENVAGPGRAEFALQVERLEYLSGDRHIYGTVPIGGEPSRVIARLPSNIDTPIAAGESHAFAVPAQRLRFFDADSGLRTEPIRLGA
jgi:multiple sugar transport system ATP-binding protein